MKNWKLTEIQTSARVSGFDCEGSVVFGDWIGDRSAAGYWQDLGPYVNDLTIYADGVDVTDYIDASKDVLFEDALIEAACDHLDMVQERRDDIAAAHMREGAL